MSRSRAGGRSRLRVRVPRRRLRSGRVRKGYTYLREDLGAPGRGPEVVRMKREGSLKRHGYSLKKGSRARRRAIDKAVKAEGARKVWQRLHALSVLHKRTNPAYAKRAKRDRDYVRHHWWVMR